MNIEYGYESSYNGEPIRADDILPCEQETVISFAGDSELATIYSAKPTIIRGLLKYPGFTIEEVTLREIRGKEAVVAVLGKLPTVLSRLASPARLTATVMVLVIII